MNRSTIISAITMAMFPAALSMADDWPQWLGPNRNGISNETGLLQEWPEGGPERVWISDKAGLGYAGFSIVDGRLFTMGSKDNISHVMAFDATTGKPLWSTPIGTDYDNGWGDGPRSTPSVDGKYVYALSSTGVLICCQAEDGKEVWRKTMEELGGKIPNWGFAESPLVDGQKVLCTPGGPQGAVVALNKMTGDVLWQSIEVEDDAHYSSIVKASFPDQDVYIQLMPNRLIGLGANDGTLLWESQWPGRTAVIPTPIYKDNEVFISSGYGVGCRLVKLSEDGRSLVEEVYSNKIMKSKHNGVMPVGDYLYGFSDGSGWLCQDWKTGKSVWREKGKLGMGSIGYADGRLYCVEQDDGIIVLLDASPEDYQERGRFTLEPQSEQRNPRGRIWVHPVVANGKLYLRDQEYIYCYDVSKE